MSLFRLCHNVKCFNLNTNCARKIIIPWHHRYALYVVYNLLQKCIFHINSNIWLFRYNIYRLFKMLKFNATATRYIENIYCICIYVEDISSKGSIWIHPKNYHVYWNLPSQFHGTFHNPLFRLVKGHLFIKFKSLERQSMCSVGVLSIQNNKNNVLMNE